MSTSLKREGPLLLLGITFGVMIAEYFLVPEVLKHIASDLKSWAVIIMALAVVYSTLSLFTSHAKRVSNRTEGKWIYSLVLLICLVVMVGLGLIQGNKGYLYRNLYSNIASPIGSAMVGTTAFFITSAAYRAFRARNKEAAILLIFGVLVMLGNMPMSPLIFPQLREWIMDVPSAAGFRGMWITFAIGMIAVAIRTILGHERAALGGAD